MSVMKGAAAAIVMLLADEEDEPKRKRSCNVNLLREYEVISMDDCQNLLRMSTESFQQLLSLVSPLIFKRNTVMREAIPADKRLIATLMFLATGRSLEDLKSSTAISSQALGNIIPQTCNAIFQVLKDEYLKFPSNESEWEEVSSDFYETWNFPNCGGALDGRHIAIAKPPHSGNYYCNYKGFSSIILLALANANYEFILVDVRTNGRVSDSGVMERNLFNSKLKNNTLGLPDNSKTINALNFVFIGDEAFRLGEHFMRPFATCELNPKRKVFNYRLSRARTVVENALGIMADRFRILHTIINFRPKKVESIVKACCVLHNYLIRSCRLSYAPSTLLDLEDIKCGTLTTAFWRKNLHTPVYSGLQASALQNYTAEANRVREEYLSYFNGKGKVPWQSRMVDAWTTVG